ncbi:MAG: ABC transporter ATP-binding protein [Proteobacteria bacterium]|nr:ABC transporter ATP-binding protein [Pseudomonadota bacterium]
MSDVVVATRGLTRRFGAQVAVDDVDLAVERGSVFGFLGPNGSGKSTLLRMLLGLLRPSAGSALVLGCEMPRDAERLRPSVGYMPQRFSLYEELTVEENLRFAGRVFGLFGRRLRDRLDAVLAEHELAPQRRKRAGALSGGWKQRLALSAAIVHEPKLLVLDEPTAGVDPQSRRAFWERLFELAATGTTILVSTHYMDEAVRCHRLCMLRDGRRAALGPPSALLHALRGRVVECRVEHIEAAIARLAGAPEVASITQLGDTAHVLLAPGAGPAEVAAETLRGRLEAAGFSGVSAAPGTAALEDVFVALMRGEQLETDAAGVAGGTP